MTEAEQRNINALKSRVGDLERQIQMARIRVKEALIAAHPLKIGDKIITNQSGRSEQVTVSGFRLGAAEKVVVLISYLKFGGDLWKNKHALTTDNWEKVP